MLTGFVFIFGHRRVAKCRLTIFVGCSLFLVCMCISSLCTMYMLTPPLRLPRSRRKGGALARSRARTASPPPPPPPTVKTPPYRRAAGSPRSPSAAGTSGRGEERARSRPIAPPLFCLSGGIAAEAEAAAAGGRDVRFKARKRNEWPGRGGEGGGQ